MASSQSNVNPMFLENVSPLKFMYIVLIMNVQLLSHRLT